MSNLHAPFCSTFCPNSVVVARKRLYDLKGEYIVSTRKKIMVSLIVILLLLTAGAYGYGVYYFTEHFLPGSMVNGFNCSYMTVSESEDLLTKKVGAYVLTINTRNNGQ